MSPFPASSNQASLALQLPQLPQLHQRRHSEVCSPYNEHLPFLEMPEAGLVQWPTEIMAGPKLRQTFWTSASSVCISIPSPTSQPPTPRKLSCSADAAFHELHRALQIILSCPLNCTYVFSVHDPSFSPADGNDDAIASPLLCVAAGMGRPLDRQPGMSGAGAIDSRMRRHDDFPWRMRTVVSVKIDAIAGRSSGIDVTLITRGRMGLRLWLEGLRRGRW